MFVYAIIFYICIIVLYPYIAIKTLLSIRNATANSNIKHICDTSLMKMMRRIRRVPQMEESGFRNEFIDALNTCIVRMCRIQCTSSSCSCLHHSADWNSYICVIKEMHSYNISTWCASSHAHCKL